MIHGASPTPYNLRLIGTLVYFELVGCPQEILTYSIFQHAPTDPIAYHLLYCIVSTIDISSQYARILQYMNQGHLPATADLYTFVIAALRRDPDHQPIQAYFYSPQYSDLILNVKDDMDEFGIEFVLQKWFKGTSLHTQLVQSTEAKDDMANFFYQHILSSSYHSPSVERLNAPVLPSLSKKS